MRLKWFFLYLDLLQRSRPVPILLPSDTYKALAHLADAKIRKRAGIREGNQFLFATSGIFNTEFSFYFELKSVGSFKLNWPFIPLFHFVKRLGFYF